jgi:predicted N-acetyltransferase YhbS
LYLKNLNVIIRQEKESDFPDVYSLIKNAFSQDDEAKLVEQLRNSDSFIPALSLVAEIKNKITGHILFTKIKIRESAGREYDSLALAPLAVMPEFQKKGIGGRLIFFGLNKAKELGHKSVIVLGHEDYYTKFGFIPAHRWKIKSPFDVPAGAFMGLELVKDGLKNVKGTVQYPEEFESV